MLINNKQWRKLPAWNRYLLLLNANKKTVEKWEEK